MAKQLGGDKKLAGWVKCLAWSDQPLITVHVRHIVRRQKHCVITSCIQMSISAINDLCLWQNDSTLGMEIMDDKFMRLRLKRGFFTHLGAKWEAAEAEAATYEK